MNKIMVWTTPKMFISMAVFIENNYSAAESVQPVTFSICYAPPQAYASAPWHGRVNEVRGVQYQPSRPSASARLTDWPVDDPAKV